jgi:hypothetical protein
MHIAVGHIRVGVAGDCLEDFIARADVAQSGETGVPQVVELQVAGVDRRLVRALLAGVAQPDLGLHARRLKVAVKVAIAHRRATLAREKQVMLFPALAPLGLQMGQPDLQQRDQARRQRQGALLIVLGVGLDRRPIVEIEHLLADRDGRGLKIDPLYRQAE